MAETAPHPNNALVAYRGKRKMASDKHGIPEGEVGKEFVRAAHKKRLPAHAKKLAKRGMISEKAMRKMKGEE
jgi:hypothetical protein